MLEGSKAPFENPGALGKMEFIGSMHNVEAGAGSSIIPKKADVDVNLFFEVPENARFEDFNLKYG